MIRKRVRAVREGRAKNRIVEAAKDATATVVRKAMASKVGCARCQSARRKAGAKVLKAIGRI
jgi:hypothetical protein